MYLVETLLDKKILKISLKESITTEQIIGISDEVLRIKETTMPGEYKTWIKILDEVNLIDTQGLKALSLTIARAKIFGLTKIAIQIPDNDNLMNTIISHMLANLYSNVQVPSKIVTTDKEALHYLESVWKA